MFGQLTKPSGIFGYINYLIERDRRYIVDTLLNGQWTTDTVRDTPVAFPSNSELKDSRDLNIVAMTLLG